MINSGLTAFLEKFNDLMKRQEAEGIEPSPSLARKALATLASYAGTPPENVSFFDKDLPCHDRLIPCRIYNPGSGGVRPVYLFLHGGGHMCGSIETYDVVCRKMSVSSGCVLVSVDYRLAPEYPYPAGLDDCREVLLRMPEILQGITVDSSRIILGGDSGGGALAATLASELGGAESPVLAGLILVYASLDYTMSSESYSCFARGYFLEAGRIRWYFDNYFPEGFDRVKASPLFMCPENFPPTLIMTAGYDPLLGDSTKYRDILLNSGGFVDYVEYSDMIHAFLFLERLVPDVVSDAYAKIARFISGLRH